MDNDLALWDGLDDDDVLDVLSDNSVLDVLSDDDVLAVLEPTPEVIDVPFNLIEPTPEVQPLATREDKPLATREDKPLDIVDTSAHEIERRDSDASAIIETDFAPATRDDTTLATYEDTTLDTSAREIERRGGLFSGLFRQRKSNQGQPAAVAPSRRWHFIAEAPDALTDVECLRYWFFLFEFASLTEEWDESAFVAWCEGLDADSWAAYVEVGREVASGELANHLDPQLANAFASMQQSNATPDDSPLAWLRRWF